MTLCLIKASELLQLRETRQEGYSGDMMIDAKKGERKLEFTFHCDFESGDPRSLHSSGLLAR